jgi:DNA-binding HxlR family transcriptional regulator
MFPTLLSKRLGELERAGIVERRPLEAGRRF